VLLRSMPVPSLARTLTFIVIHRDFIECATSKGKALDSMGDTQSVGAGSFSDGQF